jgi:trehalose 6-phosphate synthase
LGAGGLLTALCRALQGDEGTWLSVGDVAGRPDSVLPRNRTEELGGSRVKLERIHLGLAEFDSYYNRVANGVMWPIHLGLVDHKPRRSLGTTLMADWNAYESVNSRLASVCAGLVDPHGHVIVQDYHLALVPSMIHSSRPDVRIAHFTHIPWADPSDFAMLPRNIATALIDGMLGADLVGFYVWRWARNFVRSCRDAGFAVSLKSTTVQARDGRRIPVRAYPLGVEPEALRQEAASAAVQRQRQFLERLVGHRRLVVRVERMDPAKNLLRGLDAFESFLRREPSARDRVVHFVLACASRPGIAEYRAYADEVERRVAVINEDLGTTAWRPVVLESRENYALGLAAMCLADVVIVNSLRDGMNIVAKEAPTVGERDPVLILSRNAGAVDDLGGAALVIDPYETADLVDALTRALTMSAEERRSRAAVLRKAAAALPPREWLAAQRRDLLAPVSSAGVP